MEVAPNDPVVMDDHDLVKVDNLQETKMGSPILRKHHMVSSLHGTKQGLFLIVHI